MSLFRGHLGSLKGWTYQTVQLFTPAKKFKTIYTYFYGIYNVGQLGLEDLKVSSF